MLNSTRLRLFVLVTIVSISGLSQGMLLPTVAVILENHGVPSTINGIHATGLYIGVLLASPFMEGPLRKFGFKPLIVVGGFITIISLLFLPLQIPFYFGSFCAYLSGLVTRHYIFQHKRGSLVSHHQKKEAEI